jgi:integrase/recombinase XerD
MILLLLKTGVRKKELMAMDVGDIDWQTQSILLKPTKKRSNRTVFFDQEAARYLKAWLRVREDRNKWGEEALWITTSGRRLSHDGLDRIFRKAAINAGLHDVSSERSEDHCSPHNSRHFFTTHLLRAGMKREYVSWLRGDAIREAIDIYFHINETDVREAYLACIPRLGI